MIAERKPAGCALCAQIRGEPSGDLIAHLLPGRSYQRRVLLETAAFAAIPSLGALVSGHTLLCPKRHVCSLAHLGPDARSDLARARIELDRLLTSLYGAPVQRFEHGMAHQDARVVCTVDHAHLHFLPAACAFRPEQDDLRWKRWQGSFEQLLDHLRGQEYLLYEADDGTRYFCTAEAGTIPSQHLRRVFARLLGRPHAWDWRARPAPAAAHDAWARARELTSPIA